jgi:hypothetical protein
VTADEFMAAMDAAPPHETEIDHSARRRGSRPFTAQIMLDRPAVRLRGWGIVSGGPKRDAENLMRVAQAWGEEVSLSLRKLPHHALCAIAYEPGVDADSFYVDLIVKADGDARFTAKQAVHDTAFAMTLGARMAICKILPNGKHPF